MGRSTSSCFKIITCAGDSGDVDDLESPKSKGSGDKRGWSFRKRSARNQVISNTVILEAPPVNNESSQSAPLNFQANSNVPEKTSILESTNDTTQLSTPVSSKLSEIMAVTKEDDNGVNPDESVIIIIQAGIRRFLAKRAVLKQKNIVKLQAAVRGHLVRRHAVGTLRCVVAIVRMQALVRARHHSKLLQKRNPGTQRPTYVSIAKLLSNRFARQLLESTPRNKPINIKCDPSRSDTAWQWMERWMAVSPGLEQSPTLELSTEIKDHNDDFNQPENQVENIVSPATLVESESEENLTQRENSDFHPVQTNNSESVLELETEEPKRFANEQPENEGRKSTSLSRKATNPAFIAAQSKFEELTLTTTNKDFGAESCTDNENSIPQISKVVQVGSSECGTELSITSTLDSPDRSEIEPVESKLEPKIEAEVDPTISIQPEKSNDGSGAQNEVRTTDIAVHQAYKSSSPEASPRSQITILESQGTPSSQVSTKTKKPRDNNKTGPNPKRKSLSGSKRSPINPNQDLSSNSFERLPKDHRTSRRRNSFGSPRTEGVEQEPRDSSSINSLPSYMQATESAKAKALASSSSPRSSPDVQDKEMYLKKRHSLPGSNGRQGSPRIQRSMSQAQQTAKGNGAHSQERKWQR